MTDVIGYVTDVLQNLHDGNTEYCLNSQYQGQQNENTIKLDCVLRKILDRHFQLEKQVAQYQAFLSESDSIMIVNGGNSSLPVTPNECLEVQNLINGNNYPNTDQLVVPSDNFNKSPSIHAYVNDSTNQPAGDYISNESPPSTPPALVHDDRVCLECLNQCTTVATAVTSGDFKKRVTCPYSSGPMLTLKNAINTMVEKLDDVAFELIRVAREVGEEGKLGIQAKKQYLDGDWKEMMIHLNMMASNHSEQVRDIAEVCTAVAHGDLSKKITVEVKGETLVLKNTINTMVDQLNSFASEVTRVAHEVGTEGKLGVRAQVQGVGGTWKLLTDNVNTMAANLTAQVRDIADVSKAVAKGDLSKKVTVNVRGEILDLKNTINTMVNQLNTFASEVTRVAREVGTEGRFGGQAVVEDVDGTWKILTDNVNTMATNLTSQVRDIANVSRAVARGDLSKKITVDVKGEVLELKNTINTMVDQLHTFATEVNKVAKKMGTGVFGVQANVKDVDGIWKDLTDDVNTMAENLTTQMRNIAVASKAVARGELNKKITAEVRGELLDLKNIFNTMVDQLSTFAVEIRRVTIAVGTKGRLGVQAQVQGVGGTWKEITSDFNTMVANLTSQIREFDRISAAVADGDFTQIINVDVSGEMDSFKTKIIQMVNNLRESNQKNTTAKEAAANMSHEIRTSMNGIIKMTTLTLETELTHQQRENLTTVSSLANSLLTITDDISKSFV